MAINTDSYFSNTLPSGEMTVGAGIDLFANHSVPKFAVGTKVKRQDGNIYRYAQFGAATKAGFLVSPDMNESAFIYTANAIMATSSAFQQDSETTGVYPNMVDSHYIVLEASSLTADQFAGGYLSISSGNGKGYTYRIKSNKASSGTSTTIELYDKVKVALDATGGVVIAPSKYANLEAALAGTTQNSLAVGVTVSAMTATYFGYVLTKGQIGIADRDGSTTGLKVILSDSDAGHIEAFGNGATTESGSNLTALLDVQVIGDVVQASAASAHSIINVTGLGD